MNIQRPPARRGPPFTWRAADFFGAAAGMRFIIAENALTNGVEFARAGAGGRARAPTRLSTNIYSMLAIPSAIVVSERGAVLTPAHRAIPCGILAWA